MSQEIERSNSQEMRQKASEAVVSELIKQSGDLGNYVLKATFLATAVISTAASVLAAFVLRARTPVATDVSAVPAWLWLIFAFVILCIWISILHLTIVHVRASVAISNLTADNPRKLFAGNSLFFSTRLLRVFEKILNIIHSSHGIAKIKDSENIDKKQQAIPTASVPIIEGFILFSAIAAVPFLCFLLLPFIQLFTDP